MKLFSVEEKITFYKRYTQDEFTQLGSNMRNHPEVISRELASFLKGDLIDFSVESVANRFSNNIQITIRVPKIIQAQSKFMAECYLRDDVAHRLSDWSMIFESGKHYIGKDVQDKPWQNKKNTLY